MQTAQRVINSYRDLTVWKAAVELAVDCYRVTNGFPNNEACGMVSQIRRASASVAANIAQGHGRESTVSFIQFLRIAQGSLRELETRVIVAGRVGLLVDKDVDAVLRQSEDIG